MKKFLIAGSSLASVAAAGSVGAVDVTLGGSIDMGVEFGLGKDNGNLMLGSAYNQISLSLSAAGTTDGGLRFGGSFTIGTAAEIEFKPYASADGAKYLAQKTNNDRTDILGHAYNVSGGGAVDVADIVSVKINSDWIGVESDAIQNILPIGPSFSSSAICKLAGIGTNRGPAYHFPDFENYDQPSVFTAPLFNNAGGWVGSQGPEYWPAGQIGYIQKAIQTPGQPARTLPKFTGGLNSRQQVVYLTMNSANAGLSAFSSPNFMQLPANSGKVNETYFARYSKGYVKFGGPTGLTTTPNSVTGAKVFVGPFMEVAMASSSTKMVVGALCLDGNDPSATAILMDNASKVMTVSDASIYIEGGFGKLSLQSSDFTGGVSAIAGAGDQADIEADGWVIAAEGYGLMGANPFIAMDLNKGDSLGDIEVITGGTFDLGGLALAFDVALDNPTDVLGISSWDLGATYAMGDLALGFATDSSSDWGLSAAMDIAGFGVSAVFGSSSAGDHEKSGITYVVTATTALNGYNLAIGFDQGLQPTVGVDYDLGGLNIYANYDAADEGGSVGATLSF